MIRHNRCLLNVLTLLAVLPCAAEQLFAQNWETYDLEFTGTIGGYKISGSLLNRFGSLQGSYWYDKYAAQRAAMHPRDDTFTIYLEGSQVGSRISLNQMCWYCQGIEDPERFEGTLQGNSIKGHWWKTSRPSRKLQFRLGLVGAPALHRGSPKAKRGFEHYAEKDIWGSGFFSDLDVQRELRRALRDALPTYLKWLTVPMARTQFAWYDSMLVTEIWVQHEGFSDLTQIYLDTLQNKVYVAWRGSPADTTGDVVIYGHDNPEYFGHKVIGNLSWAWLYDFWVEGNRIKWRRKR